MIYLVLKKTLIVLCALMILSSNCVYSQYTDMGETFNLYNFNNNTYIGNGSSGADFNQDGWDDITTASGGSLPRFFQSNNGVLEEVFFPITIENGPSVISVEWIDYDSDNDLDLFLTQFGGRVYLFQNDGNLNLTDVTASSGLGTAIANYYGASWCDYDRDGDLDVFISKYYLYPVNPNATMSSKLHRNNGNGTFTDVTIPAGLLFIASPTFQGTWLDFDGDGWQDLYIIIDRANYVNRLYHNQQNGTFTEVAVDVGLDLAIDAMSITPGDYDRDNDLDIFVSNGVYGNYLMQNDGSSHFTNVGAQADVEVNAICWGANWVDYDNNGWEDLFISANYGNYAQYPNFFYTNPGSFPFVNSTEQLGFGSDNNPTFCSTLSDWNNDGFFDIYNNNNDPFASDFWQNQGGENNWIGARLHGVQSNTFGVGAQIQVWTNGQIQNRYTHVGEAYLSQNSYKEIIGLGPNGTADSLVIHWPNGLVERYFDLASNQYYDFVEGATLVSTPQASNATICPNSSVELSAGNPNAVVWSNGATESSITITEPGLYSFIATYDGGFIVNSDTLSITLSEDIQLEPIITNITCSGSENGSIHLGDITSFQSVVWSTGDEGGSIIDLNAGMFSCTITKSDGCLMELEFEITEPQPLEFLSYNITQSRCAGMNNALIDYFEVQGGTPPYSYIFPENNGSLPAGTYLVFYEDSNGCSGEMPVVISYEEEISVTLDITPPSCFGLNDGSISNVQIEGGIEPYESYWNTDQLDALGQGIYQLSITDLIGCSILHEVEIEAPAQLFVNIISEDHIQNVQLGSAQAEVSGGVPPYFFQWSNNFFSDLIIDLTQGDYTVVVTDNNGCTSEQTVTIDFVTDVENNLDPLTAPIKLSPNPTSDILSWNTEEVIEELRILNTAGEIVFSENPNQKKGSCDVLPLSNGWYMLSIKTKKGSVITAPFEVIK